MEGGTWEWKVQFRTPRNTAWRDGAQGPGPRPPALSPHAEGPSRAALTAPRARPYCPARLRLRPAPRKGAGPPRRRSVIGQLYPPARPSAFSDWLNSGSIPAPAPPCFHSPSPRAAEGSRLEPLWPPPPALPCLHRPPGALWDSGGPARQRPLLPPPPQLLLHPQVQDGGGGGSSGPIPAAPCPGGPALPGLLAQLRCCLLLPRALRGPAGPARAALPRAGARTSAAAGAWRPG